MLSVEHIETIINRLEFAKKKMGRRNEMGHNTAKIKEIDEIIYELTELANEKRQEYERV